MPKVRLERILGEVGSDTATVIGTTDSGTVRVSFEVPDRVALLMAATAQLLGPFEFDVPDDVIQSIEEIDPGE